MAPRSNRLPLLVGAVLFLAALVFWALFLPQASRSIFGQVPYLDETLYLDRAAAWHAGQGADEPLFMAPLYPRLIAAVGSAPEATAPGGRAPEVYPPDALRGVRLLQVACWFGTLALVALAGRLLVHSIAPPERWAEFAAWGPAVLFLCYRPAATFAVSVLTETILTFLVLLAVYLVLRAVTGVAGTGRALAATAVLVGLALGAGALLRGTCLVLVPWAAWGFWRATGRPGSVPDHRAGTWVAPILVVSACGLAVLPAALHNSRLADRLAGPTFNAGLNLYIGNGMAANGFYVQVIPGDLREDPAGTRLWTARSGAKVSVPEADRLWREAAFDAMRDAPGRTLALWGKKVWLQVQNWEVDQLAGQAAWRAEVPLLNLLPVPYGLLSVLGLVGLCTGRRPPAVAFLALALMLLVAGQALFFVVGRYRQVLVPLWALAAGSGLAALVQQPRVAGPLLAVAVLAVVPWGQGNVRRQTTSLAWANAGQRWAVLAGHTGDVAGFARAESLYHRALTGHRTAYEPWLGLATVLDSRGRVDEAIAVLSEGAQAARQPLELERPLVGLLIRTGRRGAALARVEAVLARDPADPDMLHNASYLLAESGDLAAAEARAMALIAHHPSDPRGYADLGILKARQGQTAAAQAALEAGLRAVPGDPDLQRHLARLTGKGP